METVPDTINKINTNIMHEKSDSEQYAANKPLFTTRPTRHTKRATLTVGSHQSSPDLAEPSTTMTGDFANTPPALTPSKIASSSTPSKITELCARDFNNKIHALPTNQTFAVLSRTSARNYDHTTTDPNVLHQNISENENRIIYSSSSSNCSSDDDTLDETDDDFFKFLARMQPFEDMSLALDGKSTHTRPELTKQFNKTLIGRLPVSGQRYTKRDAQDQLMTTSNRKEIVFTDTLNKTRHVLQQPPPEATSDILQMLQIKHSLENVIKVRQQMEQRFTMEVWYKKAYHTLQEMNDLRSATAIGSLSLTDINRRLSRPTASSTSRQAATVHEVKTEDYKGERNVKPKAGP